MPYIDNNALYRQQTTMPYIDNNALYRQQTEAL